MKKVILIILLLFSFYFISCDNSFSPYAPFTEDYILNGIMRGDTSYQVVTLSHSYQPDNSDPSTYKTDPAIVGAQVEITYDNKIYVLRDSSITRTDTSQFDTPFRFYYTNNLRPGVNKTISIKAVLPNGRVLQADTRTPNTGTSVYGYDFFDTKSALDFPPATGRTSIIYWKNMGDYIYYAPDININYQVTGDSGMYRIALPLNLKPTRATSISFDSSAVRKALDNLANRYGSKSKLKIISITVDILVYDEYLSLYFSSLELGLDGFTIRIDNPDYSNIKGGYGIFGCYEKVTHTIYFSSSYLHDMGFQ